MTTMEFQPSATHAQLAAIRQVLLHRERERQAALAAAAEIQRKAQAERNLFVNAVGAVKPLKAQLRAQLELERALPLARQRELDERAVMQEAISDEFDVESLLDTDDSLSYRRPGLGPDVTRQRQKRQIAGNLQVFCQCVVRGADPRHPQCVSDRIRHPAPAI
jgi:hypothetical protein